MNCDYYPNCELCMNSNNCYFKDDTIAFIEDNLINFHEQLSELIEYYNHKETGEYYIPYSVNELGYKMDIVLEDMFKLYDMKIKKKN